MMITAGTPREGVLLTPGRLDELRRTSAETGDPVMAACLRTLDDPLGEIFVEVTAPDDRRGAAFAVGHEITAVVLSRSESDPELAPITGESVTAVLARTVGLGPAPYVDAPSLTVSEADIDALVTPPAEVSQALADHPVGSALASHSWRLWRLEATRQDAGRAVPAGRLAVLGARSHGWWALEESSEGAVLSPTTATALWRVLSGLLT
ncbi:hypothetical protein [Streptomyces xiaopingdaonensis]|uniref:hypothetical protein n=1 Tax=Streptomyces xiaopingdaonensis TaxID=1565415 RepID=UPI00031F6D6E|nr:hypothetical protein [Streptomyces xiaopingdaonensis]